VTPRTVRIVDELHGLATQVQQHLHHASLAARQEWQVFHPSLPSKDELGHGSLTVSDDDLETMVGKLRRFNDILGGFTPLGKAKRDH
jgi:hypothetical protein